MPATPALPISLRPLAWHAPGIGAGVCYPQGPPRILGRFPNPWRIQRGTLLSARLLVGLSVGGVPTWKEQDVIDAVAQIWAREASFILQSGLWTEQGKLGSEQSVLISILNLDNEGNPIFDQPSFEQAIGNLAETLRIRFGQKLVIAEIAANGQTVGTVLATP